MRNAGTKHNWIICYLLTLQTLPDCPQNQGDSDSTGTLLLSLLLLDGRDSNTQWLPPRPAPQRLGELSTSISIFIAEGRGISSCPIPPLSSPEVPGLEWIFFLAKKAGIMHPGSRPGNGVTWPRRVTHTFKSLSPTYLITPPWGSPQSSKAGNMTQTSQTPRESINNLGCSSTLGEGGEHRNSSMPS